MLCMTKQVKPAKRTVVNEPNYVVNHVTTQYDKIKENNRVKNGTRLLFITLLKRYVMVFLPYTRMRQS